MFRPLLIRPSSGFVRESESHVIIRYTEVYTAVYTVLPFTHMPPKTCCKRDLVPPLFTLTLKIILYHIVLYGFSDNCIQPDDGRIKNGRNI
jgi:hypothetical protein